MLFITVLGVLDINQLTEKLSRNDLVVRDYNIRYKTDDDFQKKKNDIFVPRTRKREA